MNLCLVTFALLSALIQVHGITDSEKCAQPGGIERRCMHFKECPKDVRDMIRGRPQTLPALERFNITACGYSRRKFCCPLAECYTWDGRPGRCLNTEDNVFNMTSRQMWGSRCIDKVTVCRSDLPVHHIRECFSNLSAFPPDPASRCCGRQFPRTLYGLHKTYFMHPWFAVLKYPRNIPRHCTGVLISTKYVLTAAHCIVSSSPDDKPTAVVLGKNNKDSTEDCLADAFCNDIVRETIPIEEIEVHPKYSISAPMIDDIALIRLEGIVASTAFIKPICLPMDYRDTTEYLSTNHTLYSVGWGTHDDTFLPSVSMRRQVELAYLSASECMQTYEDLEGNHICARGEMDSVDTYGPLMLNNNGTFEVVGIPCFKKTGGVDVPSVYTRIYEHVAWIHNNIKP